MNVIIKRFILSILVLAAIAVLIVTSFTKNVYEIKYDIYKFVPETQKHIIDKKDENIYMNASSKSSEINDAVEFLYLNSLCVSDSIVINSVKEL